MFKKIDKFILRFFAESYLDELIKERDFLLKVKEKNMTIDEAVNHANSLIREELGLNCNILV